MLSSVLKSSRAIMVNIVSNPFLFPMASHRGHNRFGFAKCLQKTGQLNLNKNIVQDGYCRFLLTFGPIQIVLSTS